MKNADTPTKTSFSFIDGRAENICLLCLTDIKDVIEKRRLWDNDGKKRTFASIWRQFMEK